MRFAGGQFSDLLSCPTLHLEHVQVSFERVRDSILNRGAL
jgi:hypothetical protein